MNESRDIYVHMRVSQTYSEQNNNIYIDRHGARVSKQHAIIKARKKVKKLIRAGNGYLCKETGKEIHMA